MSLTAAALRVMFEAGLSQDLILSIAAANGGPVDEAAERRRAKDRERKRVKSAEIPQKTDGEPPQNSTGIPQKTASLTRVLDNPLRIITLEDTQEDKSSFVSAAKPKPTDKRGTRLDPGWSMTPDDLTYALSQTLTPQEAARAADDFRDWFSAQPGQRGLKLDWPATWRGWVRRTADRKRETLARRAPAGGYGSGVEDLASIAARRRRERENGDPLPSDGRVLLSSGRL